jgi:hypothetical protein
VTRIAWALGGRTGMCLTWAIHAVARKKPELISDCRAAAPTKLTYELALLAMDLSNPPPILTARPRDNRITSHPNYCVQPKILLNELLHLFHSYKTRNQSRAGIRTC